MTTFAVTNEEPKKNKIIKFPLEAQMRKLGGEKGAFVLGILDCCREKLNEQNRAGMIRTNFPEHDEDIYNNCVISFGCPPSCTVNAESEIAVGFFERLRKIADPIDGSVLIPGDRFYRWRPNLTGETLALANEDLVLVHANWDH